MKYFNILKFIACCLAFTIELRLRCSFLLTCKTLLSANVCATSSRRMMTSFFRIFIAYKYLVAFSRQRTTLPKVPFPRTWKKKTTFQIRYCNQTNPHTFITNTHILHFLINNSLQGTETRRESAEMTHFDVFKILESHFGFSVALFDLSSPAKGVVGVRLTSRGTGHAVNLKQQRRSLFIFTRRKSARPESCKPGHF